MTLRPFQIEAVERMLKILETRRGVYNACEMGLGKSAQAIEVTNRLKATSVLIICPAVMCLVWEDEIDKWANYCKYWDVLSYNKASQSDMAKVLADSEWDVLICDEAHYIKNRTAKRTKAVLQTILPSCKTVIYLSGTPMTNSVTDVYTTFSTLYPFGRFHDFGETYSTRKMTPWGPKYEGTRNVEDLKSRMKEFFVRYTKSQVLKELPDKQYQEIVLPNTLKVKYDDDIEKKMEAYTKLLEQSFARGTIPPKPPKALATIRADQGLKKVSSIVEFVQNLLDNDVPVVLFAYHRAVIAKLMDDLVTYGPVCITGETQAAERKLAVDRFQSGETKIFIGNIVAAGVGITLTASSTVVLAELTYNPAEIAQAVDRVHRIGQRDQVNVYFFTVQGSIDEKLTKAVMEKSKNFKKVLA